MIELSSILKLARKPLSSQDYPIRSTAAFLAAIFYVGKGKSGRPLQHLHEAKSTFRPGGAALAAPVRAKRKLGFLFFSFFSLKFFPLIKESSPDLGQLLLTDLFLMTAMVEKCFQFESVHR